MPRVQLVLAMEWIVFAHKLVNLFLAAPLAADGAEQVGEVGRLVALRGHAAEACQSLPLSGGEARRLEQPPHARPLEREQQQPVLEVAAVLATKRRSQSESSATPNDPPI